MSQINKTALAEITHKHVLSYFITKTVETSQMNIPGKDESRKIIHVDLIIHSNVKIQIFTAQVQISRFRSVYKSKNSCCRQNKDPLFLT